MDILGASDDERKQRPRWQWAKEGLCNISQSNIFFPTDKGRPRKNPKHKGICGPCPAKYECLNYAIVHDEIGVWGDSTTNERARLRKFFPNFVSDLKKQAETEGWLEKHPTAEDFIKTAYVNQKYQQTDLHLSLELDTSDYPLYQSQQSQEMTQLRDSLDAALEWLNSL